MELDAITLSVLQRSFMAIATEMGITLAKVAYSPVITEGFDFSGAIYDRAGHLVASGRRDLTGLLGTLEPSIQYIFEQLGKDFLGPGDVALVNCPHEAGTHMNDVKAVKPVYWENELVGYVANVGHWTDVGGGRQDQSIPWLRTVLVKGYELHRLRSLKVIKFAKMF